MDAKINGILYMILTTHELFPRHALLQRDRVCRVLSFRVAEFLNGKKGKEKLMYDLMYDLCVFRGQSEGMGILDQTARGSNSDVVCGESLK